MTLCSQVSDTFEVVKKTHQEKQVCEDLVCGRSIQLLTHRYSPKKQIGVTLTVYTLLLIRLIAIVYGPHIYPLREKEHIRTAQLKLYEEQQSGKSSFYLLKT